MGGIRCRMPCSLVQVSGNFLNITAGQHDAPALLVDEPLTKVMGETKVGGCVEG